MIRFLLGQKEFSSPVIHVFSEGGVLVSQIQYTMNRLSWRYQPKILFIHGGVNNISKNFLFESEFDQIHDTMFQLQQLEKSILTISSRYEQTNVILSSNVVTKDGFVNARASILNDEMRKYCLKNKWIYMDNGSIKMCHLRGTVHLNRIGEASFLENFAHIIRSIFRNEM